MLVRVVLTDINPKMISAWKDSFSENPEVDIVQGSMLEQQVSAWITPTNAKASMDGGLDAVIKKHLGASIEKKVQGEVKKLYGGSMKVGTGTCVETGAATPPTHLISTPTMVGSSDDISATLNVALACCAAFQTVHMQNARAPGSIRSVAMPGLGAATGRTPPEICADLMWTAYNLFREKEFSDYVEMRKALEEILGDLGEFGDKMKTDQGKNDVKSKIAAANAPAPAPLPPDPDADDFDDSDGDPAEDDGEDDDEDFDDK